MDVRVLACLIFVRRCQQLLRHGGGPEGGHQWVVCIAVVQPIDIFQDISIL